MRSKDQYAERPADFAYFKDIFATIDGLAPTLKYFSSDQFNIEEILSLLEMKAELEEQRHIRDNFLKYLSDVIRYHTRPLATVPLERASSDWYDSIFLTDSVQQLYAAFVASLHNTIITEEPTPKRHWNVERHPNTGFCYAIVSLNYDMIVEDFTQHVNLGGNALRLLTDPATQDDEFDLGLPLVKLHGSAGRDDIVPPTWSKGFHPEMVGVWRLAYRLFARANHVRVLGYSLPESDAYVRYLLKTALVRAPNLKSIDVLCLDASSEVRARYKRFITFPRFRFQDVDTLNYLNHVRSRIGKPTGIARHMGLETAHRQVFGA